MPWISRPSTTGSHRRIRADVVDNDLHQVVTRLLDVGAVGEDGVAVPAGVHEVVRHEPDGVRSDRPGSAPRPAPLGVFQIPSTTAVVPLQWNVAFRPETCGKRPVLIAGLQTGEKPFTNAVFSWLR